MVPGLNIAAVERETGLSKDVLRVWERRYGFPVPERDPHGERVYPAEQVDRLRLIKRLMDNGHRPGKLIPLDLEALNALSPRRPTRAPELSSRVSEDELQRLLDPIRHHDAWAYQQRMQQRLAREGLYAFVQDTVAPLTRMVGEAWERGEFAVFEEHLFTEMTKRLLRQAIANLPGGGHGPRLLLTTLPEEAHGLGLLMLEALCTLEGAVCIPLGTEMPLLDIARAAEAHHADVVALSFSQCFPTRQIVPLLSQLRAALSPDIALWAGGTGIIRLSAPEGVRFMHELQPALEEIRHWGTLTARRVAH